MTENKLSDDNGVELQLRIYQQEIVNKAVDCNTIAFLPTGSGKTLISCHLIGNRMRIMREINKRKFIAFIAPTKVLLTQQKTYIEKNCTIEGLKVKEFTGDSYFNNKIIRDWEAIEWSSELENCEVRESLTNVRLNLYHILPVPFIHQVVFMTPAILRDPLERRFLPVSAFDLVIFDECHHVAMGNDDMGKLCAALHNGDSDEDTPLILGLTASPVATKKGDVISKMRLLTQRMQCEFFRPSEATLQCLRDSINKPTLYTYTYRGLSETVEPIDFPLDLRDVHRNPQLLLHIARTRMLHTTHIAGIFHQLITIKSSPLDFPELQSLNMHGTINSATLRAESTVMHRVGRVFDFHELIHQVAAVSTDCGAYCGLVALEMALIPLIVTINNNSGSQRIELNDAFWEACGRQSTREVATMTVDTTTFVAKVADILNGPFYEHHQLHSVLYNQEVALCSSLLDLLVVLLSALDCEVIRKALVVITAWGIKFSASGTAIDMSTIDATSDPFADSTLAESESFSAVLSLLRLMGDGLPLDIDHTDKHITVTNHDNSIVVKHSTLKLGDFSRSICVVCSVLRDVIPVDSLVQRFMSGPQVSHKVLDSHMLPVFANKVECMIDAWRSMSSDSGCSDGMTSRVRKLTGVGLKGITSVEWAGVKFNSTRNSGLSNITTGAGGNSTLVFCEMKLMVEALCFLFERVTHCWTATAGVSAPCPVLPGCIHGGKTGAEQRDVLTKMKSQEVNFLFATSVAEEGLDVQSCQLIVNFDGAPKTVKSFIQRRGRARSKHSVMVSLIPEGSGRVATLHTDSIELFAQQERDMDAQLQSWLRGMDHLDSVGDDASDQLSISEMFPPDSRFTVPSTGAFVDTVSAIALVMKYCESLYSEHDAYYKPQPVFAFSGQPGSYSCSLLLPQGVPPSARCFVASDRKKAIAKGMVCVSAVAKLHFLGEFDDHLRIPQLAVVDTKKLHEDMRTLSAMKDVHVKTVPDAMLSNTRSSGGGGGQSSGVDSTGGIGGNGENGSADTNNFGYHKVTAATPVIAVAGGDTKSRVLHLYHLVVDPVASASCVNSSCFDCASHATSANLIGIALLRPLPQNMLHSTVTLSVRHGMDIHAKLHYLGLRECSNEEVLHMKRFHRAVCGGDITSVDSTYAATSTDDDWTKSSHGAWYVAFPVPLDARTQEVDSRVMDSNNSLFLEHLQNCAGEACHLFDNLHLIRTDAIIPTLPSSIQDVTGLYLNGVTDPVSYVGLLIFDQLKQLVCVPPVDPSNRVRLSDVIRKTNRRPSNGLTASDDTAVDQSTRATDCTVIASATAELVEGNSAASAVSVLIEITEAVSPKTYHDQFTKHNDLIVPVLKHLEANPAHHLLTTYMLSKKRTVCSMLSQSLRTTGKTMSHVVPELCSVIGQSKWYYYSLVFPSAMHRVLSVLLAHEAREFIQDNAPAATGTSVAVPSPVPPLTVSLERLLEALTPKMCHERMNSERLEMLGDSLLKFTMSVELYRKYPHKQEGFLTSLRGHLVSNLHLCRIAEESGLARYLRPLPLYENAKDCVHFQPPGCNVRDANGSVGEQLQQQAPPQHVTANVKFKTLADLVEAVIGAYYIDSGLSGGLFVMHRLGLLPVVVDAPAHGSADSSADSCNKRKSGSDSDSREDLHNSHSEVVTHAIPALPLIPSDYNASLRRMALGRPGENGSNGLFGSNETDGISFPASVAQSSASASVESVFGYRFTNSALLREALTHASVQHASRSYERLEFLGDAVLDFIVVEILYRERPELDQGGLTSAKSKVTCNMNLARFSLQHQLYLLVQQNSVSMTEAFARLKNGNHHSFLCSESTDNTTESGLPTDAEPVCKILADICESIIGAIYLDSGRDLSVLQAVAREIMGISGVDDVSATKEADGEEAGAGVGDGVVDGDMEGGEKAV